MAKTTKRVADANATVAALATTEGKLPPQDIAAEEAVLGALMLDHDAFQEVGEILQPEHFYKDEHQRIYAAMVRLNTTMRPIDQLTVADELKRTDELDKVGKRLYLVQLTERVASAINIEHHARIIFQKFLQRSLISLGYEMQNNGYDDTYDVDEQLEHAEAELFNLSQGSIKKDVQQVSPVIAEAIQQMKEAAKRKDNLSGLTSGFHGIDKVTSGWQKSTMVVIAARPAMGKTAFVLSMIRHMAVDANIPVAMFSLEMSNVELVKRLMTAETEITSDKIKNGRLTTDEWTHFQQRIERLNSAPIYIDDTPGLSVYDLRSKARILHKKHKIQAIVIDYLQLMTASAMRPGNRQEEVSMISRSLKGLAKELEIPIIALSQLNRGVENRGVGGRESAVDTKRPQLSDLRESGAIEQDADMVCFIHRPEYYGIKEDANGNSLQGMAQFIIAKHRSGACEDITLRFRAELIRFEEPQAQDMNVGYQPEPMSGQILQSSMGSMMNSGLGSFGDDQGQMPDLMSGPANSAENLPF